MEKHSSFLQTALNKVNCLFELVWRQTIQGSFLEYTVDSPVRPLFGHIHSLPMNASLQISFLTFFLVDEGPTKIRADQIFVTPTIKRIDHCTFSASQLQHSSMLIHEFSEEIFEQMWRNIPIINFLLFEFVPSVPVALDIVLWQILGKAILYEELLILA